MIDSSSDFISKSRNDSPVGEKTRLSHSNIFSISKESDSIVRYESYDKITKNFSSENVMTLEVINNHPLLKCDISDDAKLTIPSAPLPYLLVHLSDNICEHFLHKGPFPSCDSGLIDCPIESFRKLSSDDSSRETLEVQLSLPLHSELHFQPGDSFSIFPENTTEEVDLFISLLGLDAVSHHRCEVLLDPNSKKRNAQVPRYLIQTPSLKDFVRYCLDIRSVPKKPFIRALIDHTSNPMEKRKLTELISKECPSAYTQQVRENGMCLLDLLLVFRSCKPTLSLIFEHVPKLLPRSYSITSSPLLTNNSISFAFNVIDISKNDFIVFNRKGICTGWLQKLCTPHSSRDMVEELGKLDLQKNDTTCQIYQRCNQHFRLPENPLNPIIMVGPGTGVAPFVGFLLHKLQQLTSTGPAYLFFGCRTERNDFIFRQELDDFKRNGVLTELYTSFSRQPPMEVKYVQDNIKIHRNDICRLICRDNAVIYVCGDAKNMARDVMEAFVEIIQSHLQLSLTEARTYMAQLQLDKRYLQDVWI